MSSWGSPVLDPKKLQNEQFYIIDWIRKKLLFDVAILATYCHYDDDVLLEVLGTLGKCYVSNPVAKTVVWIENHDWHNCFWMSSWGSPVLDPKKLQNEQFYIIDWIRKKTPVRCCHFGNLLPLWWWCTIGSFGNPAQMLWVVSLVSQPFQRKTTRCIRITELGLGELGRDTGVWHWGHNGDTRGAGKGQWVDLGRPPCRPPRAGQIVRLEQVTRSGQPPLRWLTSFEDFHRRQLGVPVGEKHLVQRPRWTGWSRQLARPLGRFVQVPGAGTLPAGALPPFKARPMCFDGNASHLSPCALINPE